MDDYDCKFVDPEEDEAGYYRETLECGLRMISEALDLHVDYYDRDQADGASYLDCFHDAAEALKKFNIRFDPEQGEFVQVTPTPGG